ncbi:MAG: putative sugar nucleotidyl transferase [Planctomycetota bacterium]
MNPAIVFDDGRGLLAPLRDLRPIFECRFGAMRTIERQKLGLQLDLLGVWVPESLEALSREKLKVPVNTMPGDPSRVLLVSGRWALPDPDALELRPGEAIIEAGTGDVVAAYCTLDKAKAFIDSGFDAAALGGSSSEAPAGSLVSRPWHARAVRDDAIDADLRVLMRRNRMKVPPRVDVIGHDDDILIDPKATVMPGVVLDASGGPVIVSMDAIIRPGAVLIGPVCIGPRCTVNDNAVIRPHTAIGSVCKVGGEVGGCVFQGYSNKGHDGYLGDSWVGEWVNLGAATVCSNLLNTYGEVMSVAEPGGRRERTGQNFLGPVIGDHTKTAIGTRLMTGSVIGTGTMWAASAALAGNVSPFTWAVDSGMKLHGLSRFEETMHAMMARRKMEPGPAYAERVRTLHAAAAG